MQARCKVQRKQQTNQIRSTFACVSAHLLLLEAFAGSSLALIFNLLLPRTCNVVNRVGRLPFADELATCHWRDVSRHLSAPTCKEDVQKI